MNILNNILNKQNQHEFPPSGRSVIKLRYLCQGAKSCLGHFLKAGLYSVDDLKLFHGTVGVISSDKTFKKGCKVSEIKFNDYFFIILVPLGKYFKISTITKFQATSKTKTLSFPPNNF